MKIIMISVITATIFALFTCYLLNLLVPVDFNEWKIVIMAFGATVVAFITLIIWHVVIFKDNKDIEESNDRV